MANGWHEKYEKDLTRCIRKISRIEVLLYIAIGTSIIDIADTVQGLVF